MTIVASYQIAVGFFGSYVCLGANAVAYLRRVTQVDRSEHDWPR